MNNSRKNNQKNNNIQNSLFSVDLPLVNTNEELEKISKAVSENVFGGIERMQDLPTKPKFNIDFEDYGFKSIKHFMEYQNSLFVGNSLESWTGGN